MAANRPVKKTTLANLVSLGVSSALMLPAGTLLLSSPALSAADSEWSCRISADGSSWDCYRDGDLVIQPPPQDTSPVTGDANDADAQSAGSALTAEVPASVKPDSPPDSDAAEYDPAEQALAETIPETKTTKASAPASPPVSETAENAIAEQAADKKLPAAKTAAALAVTTDDKTPELLPEPKQDRPAETPTLTSIEKPAEPVPEPIFQPAVSEKTETPTAASITQETSVEPAAEQITAKEPVAAHATTAQPAYCKRQVQQITRKPAAAGEADTFLAADDAIMDDVTGIADLRGRVELKNDDQTVRSDTMQYNIHSSDVVAEGNFMYERPDLQLLADSASMNLDNETGEIRQATYRLPGNNARGSAEQMELVGDGVSRYQKASYTTCAPGNEDWIFNAAEVELDQNSGVGTAKDIKLYFKDTPIVYLPWATFPLDDRRKSGFLVPSVGSSDSTGFDLSIPYYFNLAPNYDATLVPRLMSDRGILLGGEFRYLDPINTTLFIGEILPDDDEYKDNEARGSASLLHSSRFNDRLSASLDLAYVSDQEYLEDLGDSLAVTSTRYLERSASLRYNGDYYNVTGLLQEYQTIDKDILPGEEPYKKLPQITFSGSKDIAGTNFSAGLLAQYTLFDHELDTKAKGSRFDIMPTLTYDWRQPWGFIKPRASARYTSYDLDDHSVSSVDRTTATFSLDSGLVFERNTSWFGNSTIQTLEPRLFYVYTPEEDQSDIPLFDTSEYTFSTASLFRENRFSGADRIADANQLSLALTTRFLSEQTSKQFLALTLGQILYFDDREVQLDYSNPDPGFDKDTSSYIATLSSQPSDFWSVDAGLLWDSGFNDMKKAALRVKYEGPDRQLLSARYHYDTTRIDDDPLEYTKFSAYWPVAFNTRLVGHSYYSLEENRAIESVIGIEHGSSCCWRIRAIARDYQVNADNDSNLSFLLQLELTGFAQLGDNIDSFLENTIDGFVREN